MAFMKSALLVCITAVAVLYLPILWTKPLPVLISGTTAPGFEPVLQLYRENFANGVEYPIGGSAFSVYYKGSKVVDIWGGYADSEALRPWMENTMAVVFSTTKGVAATCMALLVDRGQLDYDRTVASYWPEFAQEGKENITVRMLLSHEAGLPYTSKVITQEILGDQEALSQVLAESPPVWEPGTAHGYHTLTFGLYASQLLRRADPKHRTLGKFFKEEIAEPFGIDFFIGTPFESFYRVGRLTGDISGVVATLLKGMGDPLNREIVYAMIMGTNKDLATSFERFSLNAMENYRRAEVLALENPSAGGVGTARGIAKLFGILANGGQTIGGQRLLSEDVISKFIGESKAPSLDRTVGIQTAVNLGYTITKSDGVEQFGHPGSGGMQGRADPQRKLSFGYVSSYHSPFGLGNDQRFLTLQKATYECVQQIEGQ
ncbi:beta-lactamase domain-containing protein 2-like [Asterias amurensis]|uniref:beta-lactamase domain-containing protein 2-like n=1 Tax=Asterias amurensis TaxID=7602 RepID=UPI003AB82991